MPLTLKNGSRLVAATHNPGKVVEISALLEGRFDVVSAGDRVVVRGEGQGPVRAPVTGPVRTSSKRCCESRQQSCARHLPFANLRADLYPARLPRVAAPIRSSRLARQSVHHQVRSTGSPQYSSSLAARAPHPFATLFALRGASAACRGVTNRFQGSQDRLSVA